LVLALLCAAAAVRLLRPDAGHGAKFPLGLLAIVAFAALKCGYDLLDRRLDPERRLLSVAGFVPAGLFLLSFYAAAAWGGWLLALAAAILCAGTLAAFLTGRKLRATPH
jgi:drug/metabolite transporter (DMT)-like permease